MKKVVNPGTWLKQLCAGEESAYEILFNEYYQILAHFAMKYIPNVEICEDIIHDVFMDIYKHKRTFENINSLKSFLYLAIRNSCLNHLDHEKVKERYLEETASLQQEEFFLDAIIEEEVFYLMNKAIKELPPKIQNIYELSFQGKTNEEIAQIMGISLDSVKSYKKRGKQILKEKLKYLMYFLSVTFWAKNLTNLMAAEGLFGPSVLM